MNDRSTSSSWNRCEDYAILNSAGNTDATCKLLTAIGVSILNAERTIGDIFSVNGTELEYTRFEETLRHRNLTSVLSVSELDERALVRISSLGAVMPSKGDTETQKRGTCTLHLGETHPDHVFKQ